MGRKLTGNRLRVFPNVRELQLGDAFAEPVCRALTRSKLLLAVTTPHYFSSVYALTEWLTFERRSESTGTGLIIPLVVKGGRSSYPDWFNRYKYLNVPRFRIYAF